ncbi:PhoH family protein [Anaeromyxobacter paludicola]|uniref:PhoH-like protein n=1 Tax=Anaeromyxobacter paludicola TaxID=2918171 RepID=A0ABN6N8U5_9BACT|nr:PhoH family protein [Anaeromyxobacter paludicola]BDG08278.1 phosphate starvation protein PhoH [Anaeromyxobacter paludicola]
MSSSAAPSLETRRIEFPDNDKVRVLCGAHNENLKLIEKRLGVQVGSRGGQLVVAGQDVEKVATAERLLNELYELAAGGYPLYLEDVDQATKLAGQNVPLKEIFGDTVYVSARHRIITPKGVGQKRYIQAIRDDDIVFGIGPAGTGKTYLAMAMAVSALVERRVKRIVLCRPAVEAGEKLGFLPGDIAEKVNPYLRPLYDALFDMVDYEKASAFIERGTVEVAPLAFMRGRTLNDSFIILDEAQNTTSEQMKMFLTRLGYGSKAVITGDVTQVDLPTGRASGLLEVQRVLKGVEGIGFCTFTEVDVVRHPLVQEVVKAYDAFEAERRRPAEPPRGAAGPSAAQP